MTDGLKHVVHRRVHLERSQPLARRATVGRFLEKKKDYKVRAERYHVMEKRIKDLAAMARFRNEDEFNFKMVHGKLGEDGTVILPSEKAAAERKLNRKGQFKKVIAGIDQNRFVMKHRLNVKDQRLKETIAENATLLMESGTHTVFPDDSQEESAAESDEETSPRAHTRMTSQGKRKSAERPSAAERGSISQNGKGAEKGVQKRQPVRKPVTKAVQEHLQLLSETIHNKRSDILLQQGLDDERNLRTALHKKQRVSRARNSNTRYYPFERQK